MHRRAAVVLTPVAHLWHATVQAQRTGRELGEAQRELTVARR